jgi:hypothetical protein
VIFYQNIYVTKERDRNLLAAIHPAAANKTLFLLSINFVFSRVSYTYIDGRVRAHLKIHFQLRNS